MSSGRSQEDSGQQCATLDAEYYTRAIVDSMVYTIDKEARQRLLADAVWRLIRLGGLEAASVRAVAAEAELSTGSVRHFFTTQDELHVFAMEALMLRTSQRVEQALDAAAQGSPREQDSPEQALNRVMAGLRELLPIHPEASSDFQAHLQFVAKAAVHPPLAETARVSYEQMQEFYYSCIDHLVKSGAFRSTIDRRSEVQRLAVVIDGLALRRLTAPELITLDDMSDVLFAHFGSLPLGG